MRSSFSLIYYHYLILSYICFRDISYTTEKLQETNFHQILVNLEILMLQESAFAYPPNWKTFLSLPKIQFISGVNWSSSCEHCNLTKTKRVKTPLVLSTNYSKMEMFFTKGSNFDEDRGNICLNNQQNFRSPSVYLRPGFTLHCVCDLKDCVTEMPLNRGALKAQQLQKALNLLHPLHSFALVLNLVALVLVATSKSARKSPTLLLILNMAICDLLLSIFCILSAIYNIYPDSDKDVVTFTLTGSFQDLNSFLLLCPWITFLFSVTQMLSVLTSVFLTVEKYLSIVYCMRPGVRMSRKIVMICLSVSWFIAIVYFTCVVLLTFDEERRKIMNGKTLFCSATGHSIGHVSVHQVLSYTYILVYLLTTPLYIRIYLVVRRSSFQLGLKREGALARKLVFLVATNLLFSAVPNTQLPFIGSQFHFNDFSDSATKKSTSIYVVCSPFFLLGINACLNPFLFAFRHHLVKKHMSHWFRQSTRCCREETIKTCKKPRANIVHHLNKGFEANETSL